MGEITNLGIHAGVWVLADPGEVHSPTKMTTQISLHAAPTVSLIPRPFPPTMGMHAFSTQATSGTFSSSQMFGTPAPR